MVPTIGRWDTTMIHQAIKDIKVEDFEIADLTGEKVKDSSKKTKKRLTRKRKSIVATKDVMEPDQISKIDEAHQCSTIDEAQQ
ncbi:hypothetical protein ACFX2B_037554 [Malus domestica]